MNFLTSHSPLQNNDEQDAYFENPNGEKQLILKRLSIIVFFWDLTRKYGKTGLTKRYRKEMEDIKETTQTPTQIQSSWHYLVYGQV